MRRRGLILVCMAVAVAASGCSVHFFGRYYRGQEVETVLLETDDEVVKEQEDALGNSGPWGFGNISDAVP